MSINGIFNKYTIKKLLKSKATICGLTVSILLCIAIFLLIDSDEYYEILTDVTNMALSLFPNLLGFCIGGYALIIGASNIDILRKLSKPLGDYEELSIFQILSSVFAMSLVIQCLTLFAAYIVHIVIAMELEALTELSGVIVNMSFIFLILAFTCMSILLLYYTIINIFNFGQIVHFSVRFDEEMNNESNNNGNKV